jgi:hypothetical protein
MSDRPTMAALAAIVVLLVALVATAPRLFRGTGSSQGAASGTAQPRAGAAIPSPSVGPQATVVSPTPPLTGPSATPTAGGATSQPPGGTPSQAPTAAPGALAATATIRTWQRAPSFVELQIVATVRNDGQDRISISASRTTYEVFGNAGSTLRSGTFAYAFPASIGPGETAYLIESTEVEFVDRAAIRGVAVTPAAVAAGEQDGPLDVSGVRWRQSDDGTLSVSGTVTNPLDRRVRNGVVAIILLDGAKRVVAGVYDNTVASNLEPGAAETFATSYPGTPPISASSVRSYLAFAFDMVAP